MSMTKASGMLKWLMVGLGLVVIFIGIKAFSSKPEAAQEAESPTLTPEEMKTLGVEGDTPRDTVATLVAQVKAMRSEMKTAAQTNEELTKENRRLRAREHEIDSRIASGLREEKDKIRSERGDVDRERNETRSLLDKFKTELNQRGANAQDLPVGFGLNEADAKGFAHADTDGITWIDPSDQRVSMNAATGGKGSGKRGTDYSFPSRFGEATDSSQAKVSAPRRTTGAKQKKLKPVYTLPQNSTLMGSVSMTALVGRVPVDGTVNDPYPFKALIGPDNLTANGIDLPEVAGAIVSGTATGDWTLSCVRGQIRSITFVFNDGTVRTLPTPKDAAQMTVGSNGSQNTNQGDLEQIQGGLGWISDPYGIPCITGERKSNAKQYIGSQVLITAAGAGVATLLSNADNHGSSSSFFSGGGTAFGASSTSGNQAAGQILSSGVSDISDWVNKLYGEAFAAVYVKPGAKVAIHIDQQLEIDYELQGRKIKYRTGAPHVSHLD